MRGLFRRKTVPEPYDWRPAFELILDEARRSIDRQMVSVREARQRAGNLLGYGAVVAAALGFSAKERAFGVLGWVALGGFLLVGGAVIYVLYPRRFSQDLSSAEMNKWFEAPDLAGVEHMLASTAHAHEANYSSNRGKVLALHRGIALAVLGLIVETCALAANLVL